MDYFYTERTHFHSITGDLILIQPSLIKYMPYYGKKYWNNLQTAIVSNAIQNKKAMEINYDSRFKPPTWGDVNLLIMIFIFPPIF